MKKKLSYIFKKTFDNFDLLIVKMLRCDEINKNLRKFYKKEKILVNDN